MNKKELREACRGLRGRFFYDAERGDIAFIAADCDAKQCDCEVKKNADGDQDCSLSLEDFWGEDHICELIVGMLNSVPALLDECDALRAALAEMSNLALDMDGHNHWDPTMQYGAGCPLCIRQRDALARISELRSHLDER